MASKRLEKLPPYLFVEIDRLKESYARSGRTVLDLGIGDPDLGAPPALVRLLKTALDRREYHRYPHDRGLPLLVDAIRRWAGRRHETTLEREEVLVTIGSKEAIGHLPLAVVDEGDAVLVPDPGYPVYHSSAVFAGAESVRVPLDPARGWWPDFAAIDGPLRERARLLYLNYPNNPTAAVAGRERFVEALDFCRDAGIVLVNDAAYGEITYGTPAQLLFPLARETGVPYIEFFSFSKTFSITGWRVGFAVGSPEIVSALARVKSNIDSGVFGAIQEAAAVALDDFFDELVGRVRDVYAERRNILARSLERSGLEFAMPQATFYFWVRTPGGADSIDFCRSLLEERGIVATPGVGFGPGGEGFFRLSITTGIETIREAGRKLEEIRHSM
ncbi:MAG: aminotransferase class I/II-fold pyridoxal phosphate-dependent enzyme [Candidatus Krumholzibacteriota bacterium]|nr:aminotransferase class I/II-fold pyridoxal phosphate-dependent enzyme [Candidatus Krumholzibacteriota bacterium]